jgi:hypothetical protein
MDFEKKRKRKRKTLDKNMPVIIVSSGSVVTLVSCYFIVRCLYLLAAKH